MIVITCVTLGHVSKDDEQFFNNMILPTTTFDSRNKKVQQDMIFNSDKPCGSLNDKYAMGGNTSNIDIEHKYEAESERLKNNMNKVLKLVSMNKDYR
jgi:hypothetical protein